MQSVVSPDLRLRVTPPDGRSGSETIHRLFTILRLCTDVNPVASRPHVEARRYDEVNWRFGVAPYHERMRRSVGLYLERRACSVDSSGGVKLIWG